MRRHCCVSGVSVNMRRHCCDVSGVIVVMGWHCCDVSVLLWLWDGIVVMSVV